MYPRPLTSIRTHTPFPYTTLFRSIDVEAALVGLVDDDGVVGRQPAVRGDLCQQDAVGHELDRGVGRDVVGEAYLEAHRTAERHLQLLGYAKRHRARGDPARLGTGDHEDRKSTRMNSSQ